MEEEDLLIRLNKLEYELKSLKEDVNYIYVLCGFLVIFCLFFYFNSIV